MKIAIWIFDGLGLLITSLFLIFKDTIDINILVLWGIFMICVKIDIQENRHTRF